MSKIDREMTEEATPCVTGESPLEDVFAVSQTRMRRAYDLLTPHVRILEGEGMPRAALEVLSPEKLGISPLEYQMYAGGLGMINEAIRNELLQVKPGTIQLVSTDMPAAVRALVPWTFAEKFWTAPLVSNHGFQWLPPGYFVDLTPEGSDKLEDALGLGTPALIALLIEMGVPKHIATLVAAALTKAGAEFIRLLRAYSDKGTVSIKFLAPLYTPIPYPT